MLLLFAADHTDVPVLGPRRATGALGTQFLPQPGLELHGMQRPERGKAGRRFSPPPLPRAPLDRHRTRRPPPRPRRPRLRQAPPSFALTETTGKSVEKEATENQPHPCKTRKDGPPKSVFRN